MCVCLSVCVTILYVNYYSAPFPQVIVRILYQLQSSGLYLSTVFQYIQQKFLYSKETFTHYEIKVS